MTTIVVLLPDGDGEPVLRQPMTPFWRPPTHLDDVDGSVWLRRCIVPVRDAEASRVVIYTPWAPAEAVVLSHPTAAGHPADDAWSPEASRDRHPSSRRTP